MLRQSEWQADIRKEIVAYAGSRFRSFNPSVARAAMTDIQPVRWALNLPWTQIEPVLCIGKQVQHLAAAAVEVIDVEVAVEARSANID